jgi:predicted nucleic acid-binding protein
MPEKVINSTLPVALLDANVLYPAPLRDTLMHLAVNVPVSVRWSAQIQAEWTRRLLEARPDLNPNRLERTVQQMNRAVPTALVTGFELLIEQLDLPDVNDRHVLAAAIHGGASVIVTNNIKDFPNAVLRKYGLVARKPDSFIMGLVEQAPKAVLEAIRLQHANLKNPPATKPDFLQTLQSQGLKEMVAWLRGQRF